jgi:hypothetical protein
MNKLLFLSFVLLFTGPSFSQPIDILVNWECDMEIEILSGRFTVGDTVSARGDFNSWGRYDLIPDPVDPNHYISEFPILIPQLEVGDTIVYYKFFYTPNTWETGDNRLYVLTQDDYNAGEATISRVFNDLSLTTVTNQETTILFTVDTDGAVSAINGLPFPVVNTVRLAGGTFPLQWPALGWPDSDIGLTLLMYDDGTHGDFTAGDQIFSLEVIFPPLTLFDIQYKYGINYGDPVNNGGGNDNEAGLGDDHFIELSRYMVSATVENVFGTMGFHDLISIVIVPVELNSFTAKLNDDQVILNWQTATETNNLGFEIHRKIIREESEGKWLKIGYREGAGTTAEPQDYSYYDDITDINATHFVYRLKQVDYDGSYEFSEELIIENSITLPQEFNLSQNYPNPFNPSTIIKFSVASSGYATLKIFNTLGEEVAVLLDKDFAAGNYEVEWNAAGLPSGIYFFQLKTEGFVKTKKMIFMK